MKKESPTTLRWLITHKWGDPAAQPDALKLIDDIVGFPAASNTGVSPAPNVTGGGVAIPARKVALVIGHNSVAKGAYADAPVSAFEYEYHNQIVSQMLGMATARDLECRRFLRTAGGGYNAEIDRVYREVNTWGPDLCVELHFNGGGGDYATMLHEQGNKMGALAAKAMLNTFSIRLGVRSWGLMPRTINHRGGRSVVRSTAPCVLTEPFFGDNEDHVKRVHQFSLDGMAVLYLDAIKAALTAIGK